MSPQSLDRDSGAWQPPLVYDCCSVLWHHIIAICNLLAAGKITSCGYMISHLITVLLLKKDQGQSCDSSLYVIQINDEFSGLSGIVVLIAFF